VYAVPFYLIGSQHVDFQLTFDIDLTLVNATGANAYLTDISNFTATPTGLNYEVQIRVRKNGGTTVISVPLDDATFLIADNPLANGSTVLDTLTGTVNFAMGVLLPTDTLTFEARVVLGGVGIGATANDVEWQNLGGTPVTITSEIDVTGLRVSILPSVNSLGFNQTIIMNDFIPEKVKQKDLVKSVMTMFNLVSEPDSDNLNHLVYTERDAYYDAGDEKNWDTKRKKDASQKIKFLPELSSKKVQLSYKDDKDIYNETYLDAIRETYGQAEYIFENEYIKGVDRKELIFSPTPMIENSFSAIVPSFFASAPKNNIRLLIHNDVATCDSFNIYNYTGSGSVGLTSYPIVHHFDDPYNPTVDINFAVCDYYFYPGIVLTNNNLYNTNWRRTLSQINSGLLLIEYFDLNSADIESLKLSDKIWTNGSWWHINKVIDYDANAEKFTKVELFSVDDEIDLPSFDVKTPLDDTVLSGQEPSVPIIQDYYAKNNVNYSQGKTIIKGVNNIVLPNVKAIVIGDNGIIDEDGYWLDGVRLGADAIDGSSKTYIFKVVSADYSINCDTDEIIEVDTSGVTITLPNRRNCVGKKIYIKNFSGGNITVDTATSNVDGSSTQTLADKEAITVTSDDTRWIIL